MHGIFLIPVQPKLIAEEGKPFIISFTKPAQKGRKYKEIGWMRGDLKSKILFYQEFITNNQPVYFNQYCKTLENCKESSTVHSEIATSDLTINNISSSDEDNYYYWFWVDSNVPDTGIKYMIRLETYGELFYKVSFANTVVFQ